MERGAPNLVVQYRAAGWWDPEASRAESSGRRERGAHQRSPKFPRPPAALTPQLEAGPPRVGTDGGHPNTLARDQAHRRRTRESRV